MQPYTAPPASALGQLVWGKPLYTAHSADFKKDTVTFQAPPHAPVAAGRYLVLPEADVRVALGKDCETGEALVLLPPREARARFHDGTGYGQHINITDLDGFDVSLYREHVPDENSTGHRRRHPAHWWGSITRKASDGTEWTRSLPRHVTDDFGTLVPVDGDA
jgi:hypothetical protein